MGWPLGKLLDCILGVHNKGRFINDDLKTIIDLHTVAELKKHQIIDEDIYDPNDRKTIVSKNNTKGEYFGLSNEEELEKKVEKNPNIGIAKNQANLMISAIEIGKVKAKDIMLSMEKAYMFNYEEVFNKQKLSEAIDKGFSRIPIYKDGNLTHIFGILRMKKLIGQKLNFERETTLRELVKQLNIKIAKPLIVNPDTTLIQLLRQFKKGKSHMAFVVENVEKFQLMIGLDSNNDEREGIRLSGNFLEKEDSCIVMGTLFNTYHLNNNII